MYLIQIFLPLSDNHGNVFPQSTFLDVRHELMQEFGGITAFTQAPADGLWEKAKNVTHDKIITFEVMTEKLDEAWWAGYRASLERIFLQEEIIVRAQKIIRL